MLTNQLLCLNQTNFGRNLKSGCRIQEIGQFAGEQQHMAGGPQNST